MSPEQARGEDLDAEHTVFVGRRHCEMATGRDAFIGRTSALVFDAILNQAPPPPSTLNPAVPPELDQAILKALEKDRAARYQTAGELRADLSDQGQFGLAPQHRQRRAELVSESRAELAHLTDRLLLPGEQVVAVVAIAIAAYGAFGGSGRPLIRSPCCHLW
jgi:serine/threonine protein kinase